MYNRKSKGELVMSDLLTLGLILLMTIGVVCLCRVYVERGK